ncbi:MAG: L-threonylcarbamoyladenylate synthase [Chloroflexota bacterium]|jgi:L-threonylcarbamoyladenylate synthase|nr:L-threonylcarbamoyladenylate synthase [Chloroflexota bacterium]
MHTRILRLSDVDAQAEALDLLDRGAVIAAPTDTVYGVMCRYDDSAAIAALFAVKDRPLDKAIPVLIGDRSQLDLLVPQPLSPAADLLIGRFWPGPLTLVLPAQTGLPSALTAGKATAGVRMPAHAGLCALIRRSGPLAATSANLSGAAEAHTAAQVAQQLAGRLPLILQDDADEAGGRAPAPPSAIVDLSGSVPRILRDGAIAADVIAALAEIGLTPC